ncbi:MAG: hypothetical protein FJ271_07540 [Planctomycetes bacterium]|nr:hypothetical protein [Planctomycetota bacterium]
MIHEGELRKIHKLAANVLHAGNFFIRPGMDLLWERLPREEIAWEISRGRLVPPRFAREAKSFTSWNVYHVEAGRRSAAPILSFKLDETARQLHVVRAVLCHVWEAVDAGNNVIDSRETTAWVPELVGTIHLEEFQHSSEAELRAEISDLVAAAVLGASRLPLTSLESPLPGFALGHLAFVDHRGGADVPLRSCRELMERLHDGMQAGRAPAELARLLEAALRVADIAEVPDLADLFARRRRWHLRPARDVLGLLCVMFNDVSLSPWTGLVDNAMSFIGCLVSQGDATAADEVDFLGQLLRQLGRHLTAYDLSTYHHRGANYPDALLLDACLKRLLHLCETHGDLFSAEGGLPQKRRRALRDGWRLRAHYEGHCVPDAPTSPGENARVLPAPFVRVPEEQLLHPGKRRRRLYDGDPLTAGEHARAILTQSLRDLESADELREQGLAVFIDRPLGAGKAPGEPDRTPLLSYLAFSRSIAARRLNELGELCRALDLAIDLAGLHARLAGMPIRGMHLDNVQTANTGIVSLADVRRVAEDFVLLRTLPAGVRQLAGAFDWRGVEFDVTRAFHNSLIVPVESVIDCGPTLAVFDTALSRVLDLTADLREGYRLRRGLEAPRAGLIVRHAGRESAVRPL